MKKILVYTPNSVDGVSYYRQMGPITALDRTKIQFTLFPWSKMEEYNNWNWFLSYDLAFMSRPHRLFDLAFLEQCHKYGLPVWLDYDDDLLNITPDNPVFHTYASKETRDVIHTVLLKADIITTATKSLADSLIKFGCKNVQVIPNALDERLLKYKSEAPREKKIAWRGSPSHLRDLMGYAEELQSEISKDNTPWTFFGFMPYFLGGPNIRYQDLTSIYDFHANLKEYKPSHLIVPLVDTPFNRAKSYLAYLDATLGGAVVFAPDLPEWCELPGITLYKCNDPKDFREKLHEFTSLDFFTRRRLVNDAWNYLSPNKTLEVINKQRMNLIRETAR